VRDGPGLLCSRCAMRTRGACAGSITPLASSTPGSSCREGDHQRDRTNMTGVVDDIDMQDAASDVSQFSEDKVDDILDAAFDQLVDDVERQVCVTRPLLDVHTVSRCTTMLLQVDLRMGKDHELHDTWIRPTALGVQVNGEGII
jgi:hypothetical protein